MELIQTLTPIGAIIAFVFSMWKYIDTRNQEFKNKRFEQFRETFIWFSGRDKNGNNFTALQQALAAYQLGEFKKYKSISLPIIDHLIALTGHEEPPLLFREALLETREKLQS